MNVLIVGAGKLAQELLAQSQIFGSLQVRHWPAGSGEHGRSVVVHAGSGRQLPEACAFCNETGSPLLELSTGSRVHASLNFPVVICANTNILMLKFMSMLRTSGHLFRGNRITLTESHQATKTSVPGTAVHIAQSLGIGEPEVKSLRDPEHQQSVLGFASADLARHAYHEVVIEGGGCTLRLQSRIDGPAPYVEGVASIVRAVSVHSLQNRLYDVTELIDLGWV